MPTYTSFDVYLNGSMIDTIFYFNSKMSVDEVKKVLIDRDGYDSSIRVVKGKKRSWLSLIFSS